MKPTGRARLVAPGDHNRRYLESKVGRSGHLVGIDAAVPEEAA